MVQDGATKRSTLEPDADCLGRSEIKPRGVDGQNEAGQDEAAVTLPGELADKEVLREQVMQAMDALAGRGRQKHINLTDRDSRLMKSSQGIVPGYNAQAMVSPLEPIAGASGMLVTAVDVVDEPNDFAQLIPMLEQSEDTTGAKAQVTLADAGYHSGPVLDECARRGRKVVMPESSGRRAQHHPYHKDRFTYDERSDNYICPHGQMLSPVGTMRSPNGTPRRVYRASGAICQACPAFGPVPDDLLNGRALTIGPHDAVLRRHRAWMSTREAQNISKRRKQLIEPVFGIIKEQQGARRFLLQVWSTWRLSGPCWRWRSI